MAIGPNGIKLQAAFVNSALAAAMNGAAAGGAAFTSAADAYVAGNQFLAAAMDLPGLTTGLPLGSLEDHRDVAVAQKGSGFRAVIRAPFVPPGAMDAALNAAGAALASGLPSDSSALAPWVVRAQIPPMPSALLPLIFGFPHIPHSPAQARAYIDDGASALAGCGVPSFLYRAIRSDDGAPPPRSGRDASLLPLRGNAGRLLSALDLRDPELEEAINRTAIPDMTVGDAIEMFKTAPFRNMFNNIGDGVRAFRLQRILERMVQGRLLPVDWPGWVMAMRGGEVEYFEKFGRGGIRRVTDKTMSRDGLAGLGRIIGLGDEAIDERLLNMPEPDNRQSSAGEAQELLELIRNAGAAQRLTVQERLMLIRSALYMSDDVNYGRVKELLAGGDSAALTRLVQRSGIYGLVKILNIADARQIFAPGKMPRDFDWPGAYMLAAAVSAKTRDAAAHGVQYDEQEQYMKDILFTILAGDIAFGDADASASSILRRDAILRRADYKTSVDISLAVRGNGRLVLALAGLSNAQLADYISTRAPDGLVMSDVVNTVNPIAQSLGGMGDVSRELQAALLARAALGRWEPKHAQALGIELAVGLVWLQVTGDLAGGLLGMTWLPMWREALLELSAEFDIEHDDAWLTALTDESLRSFHVTFYDARELMRIFKGAGVLDDLDQAQRRILFARILFAEIDFNLADKYAADSTALRLSLRVPGEFAGVGEPHIVAGNVPGEGRAPGDVGHISSGAGEAGRPREGSLATFFESLDKYAFDRKWTPSPEFQRRCRLKPELTVGEALSLARELARIIIIPGYGLAVDERVAEGLLEQALSGALDIGGIDGLARRLGSGVTRLVAVPPSKGNSFGWMEVERAPEYAMALLHTGLVPDRRAPFERVRDGTGSAEDAGAVSAAINNYSCNASIGSGEGARVLVLSFKRFAGSDDRAVPMLATGHLLGNGPSWSGLGSPFIVVKSDGRELRLFDPDGKRTFVVQASSDFHPFVSGDRLIVSGLDAEPRAFPGDKPQKPN